MPLYKGITEVAIHQVPFRHGQKKIGVEEGAEKLIEAGILKKLETRGLKAVENVIVKTEIDEKESNIEKCSKLCRLLSDTIFQNASKGRFCLNLGGDHSLGTGSLSGMLRAHPDLVVIWIDAHTDVNTTKTSPSGSVHGMPVSFVLDDPREKAISALPEQYKWAREKTLKPSKIAYIGIRQCDQGEIDTVNELKICTFDMVSIERDGIVKCIHKALERIDPTSSCPIHVSFDIDSLDPSLAPSTGTPVPGGLTLREILYVGETIYRTGRLAGMDIVEFNPKVCSEKHLVDLTAKNTLRAFNSFIGKMRPSFN